MARTAGIVASVVVVASGCAGSSKAPLLTATLTGSTVDSTFEAVVSYPATVRSGTEVMSYGADFPHGTDLRFPMNFRNTGGGVANFDFDIAYDGPLVWSAIGVGPDKARPSAADGIQHFGL